ncbi:zinc finger protein Xfin-like isoform X1 [Sitophilus oryzae]|uniref:Zinc finger protein Xfin-like isoform X1 n=1 Tax=Sitophilus oryzae TaxID=7048 RepID=A0A6J2Y2U8_SITOR|nr:zinc finger protein Xfin-like isoform X1 [Sitophilus oryzae]
MAEQHRGADYLAVCRLCLSDRTDSLKSIYDIALGPNRLPQKILQLLAVQVNKLDKISTLICNDCIIRLDTFHAYKRECHRNQTKLAEWLNKNAGCNSNEMSFPIKPEPDDFEFNEVGLVNGNHVSWPVKIEVDVDEDMDEEYNDLPPHLLPNSFDNHGEPFVVNSPTGNYSEEETRCPDCGRLFGTIQNMRRHQNVLHRKDKRTPMNEIKKASDPVAVTDQPKDLSAETEKDIAIENTSVVPSLDTSGEVPPENNDSSLNMSEENTVSEVNNTEETEKCQEEQQEQTEDEPKNPEETEPEKTQEEPTENTPESDQQKIQFAAGLKLVQKDSTPIECEPLSKIELSYIDKCKAMVSMFHTLQCACHNVQHKTSRNLHSHLRELRIWFPLFTCYNCMISFTDRSTFTKHHTKCTRTQFETLIKLSNLKKRSEVKTRLYENYKCNRCRFLYSFYEDFCKHIEEDHASGSPPFYCSCRYVFDTLEEYRNHCYNSCILSYYCDICFITTTTQEEFVKHCQELHDSSEGFVLLQEDGYSPRKPFSHHKEVDTEANVVEGKRERKKSVKPPILVQIYDSEIPPEPLDMAPKTVFKKMLNEAVKFNPTWKNPSECPLCHKVYASIHNMARHYKTHLEKNEVPMPVQAREEDDSLYSCPDCGGMYPTAKWAKHLEEKHPPKPCGDCDKMFQFQGELEQHRSVHLNLKIHRDSKTHSYKSTMLSPVGEVNGLLGEVMVMCELCDTMFKSKEELKNHKLVCEDRSNKSQSGSSLKDDGDTMDIEGMPVLETVEKTEEKKDDGFVCTSCQKVYLSVKTLKEHMKNKHGILYKRKNDFPKKCQYCDRMCTTGAALYLHTQMHERMTLNDLKSDKSAIAKAKKKASLEKEADPDEEGGSYHTCKRCFKVFATKGKLRDHMKCHGVNPAKKPSKKITCNICHVCLDNADELEKHKSSEHSEGLDGMPQLVNEMEVDQKDDDKEEKNTTEVTKIKNTNLCKYCKVTFDNFAEFAQHMHEEHDETAKPKVSRIKRKDLGDRRYKCGICKKAFVTVLALNSHAGWHKRIFAKKRLLSQSAPETNTAHGVIASKIVRQSKVFKKKITPKPQQQQPAQQASKFQCSTCSAQLPNDTALQIHILEKHRSMDEVMLVPRCETCNQDFATQNEYEMHQRFHDFLERQKKNSQQVIIKKYPCEHCSSGFSRIDTLHTHIRQHHPEHAKVEFKCTQCDRVFEKQNSLTIHLKVHEKQKAALTNGGSSSTSTSSGSTGKVFSCSICSMVFSYAKDLRTHTINAHPF